MYNLGIESKQHLAKRPAESEPGYLLGAMFRFEAHLVHGVKLACTYLHLLSGSCQLLGPSRLSSLNLPHDGSLPRLVLPANAGASEYKGLQQGPGHRPVACSVAKGMYHTAVFSTAPPKLAHVHPGLEPESIAVTTPKYGRAKTRAPEQELPETCSCGLRARHTLIQMHTAFILLHAFTDVLQEDAPL